MMFVIALRIAIAAQAVGGEALVRLTVMVVLLMSATSLPASSVGRFHQPTFINVMVVQLMAWPVEMMLDMSPKIVKNREKSQKIAKVFRHVANFLDV
jgi:hypothetical protein